jgi:hypothetical protein
MEYMNDVQRATNAFAVAELLRTENANRTGLHRLHDGIFDMQKLVLQHARARQIEEAKKLSIKRLLRRRAEHRKNISRHEWTVAVKRVESSWARNKTIQDRNVRALARRHTLESESAFEGKRLAAIVLHVVSAMLNQTVPTETALTGEQSDQNGSELAATDASLVSLSPVLRFHLDNHAADLTRYIHRYVLNRTAMKMVDQQTQDSRSLLTSRNNLDSAVGKHNGIGLGIFEPVSHLWASKIASRQHFASKREHGWNQHLLKKALHASRDSMLRTDLEFKMAARALRLRLGSSSPHHRLDMESYIHTLSQKIPLLGATPYMFASALDRTQKRYENDAYHETMNLEQLAHETMQRLKSAWNTSWAKTRKQSYNGPRLLFRSKNQIRRSFVKSEGIIQRETISGHSRTRLHGIDNNVDKQPAAHSSTMSSRLAATGCKFESRPVVVAWNSTFSQFTTAASLKLFHVCSHRHDPGCFSFRISLDHDNSPLLWLSIQLNNPRLLGVSGSQKSFVSIQSAPIQQTVKHTMFCLKFDSNRHSHVSSACGFEMAAGFVPKVYADSFPRSQLHNLGASHSAMDFGVIQLMTVNGVSRNTVTIGGREMCITKITRPEKRSICERCPNGRIFATGTAKMFISGRVKSLKGHIAESMLAFAPSFVRHIISIDLHDRDIYLNQDISLTVSRAQFENVDIRSVTILTLSQKRAAPTRVTFFFSREFNIGNRVTREIAQITVAQVNKIVQIRFDIPLDDIREDEIYLYDPGFMMESDQTHDDSRSGKKYAHYAPAYGFNLSATNFTTSSTKTTRNITSIRTDVGIIKSSPDHVTAFGISKVPIKIATQCSHMTSSQWCSSQVSMHACGLTPAVCDELGFTSIARDHKSAWLLPQTTLSVSDEVDTGLAGAVPVANALLHLNCTGCLQQTYVANKVLASLSAPPVGQYSKSARKSHLLIRNWANTLLFSAPKVQLSIGIQFHSARNLIVTGLSGAAKSAGLEIGDQIVSANGQQLSTIEDLHAVIVGDRIADPFGAVLLGVDRLERSRTDASAATHRKMQLKVQLHLPGTRRLSAMQERDVSA